MKKQLSRRDFLRMAGLAAGATLAACTPETIIQTVEVEKIVEKTVEVEKIVEKTVQVEKIVEKEVEKLITAIPEAQKIEVKGTFWVLQKQDFFPSFNDWFRQEMISWAKENDWALDISYMAGYTGGTPELEKLMASVAAGTPADLVMHNLGITQLRQAYSLEAVSGIVDTIEEKWGPCAVRPRNELRTDDQWWAVPYFQRSDGGWFQRPVFEDAGIDIHSVRTYTDLWEACLEVSDPDNELYGWGTTINRSGDGDWYRYRVQHGWGAYKQDESGKFVTFDSPEMVEAMTVMTDVYTNPK